MNGGADAMHWTAAPGPLVDCRNIAITLVDPVGYSCLAPLTSLLTHCARAMAVVLPAHFLTHRARALAVVLTAGDLADTQ
jgi:hypothetical protein